jgi:hypothetical protein
MKPSALLLLASVLFALPISCSQEGGDGLYTGGFQPSPGGNVNPAEPGFANGQGGASAR